MGFLREPSHLLIILVVVVVLFGSRRLPDAARGLGRSMRIFKSEVKQMKDDDASPAAPAPTRPDAEGRRREPVEGRVVRSDSVPSEPGPASAATPDGVPPLTDRADRRPSRPTRRPTWR